jgi:tetratricopeptide (TPR) repeat protein
VSDTGSKVKAVFAGNKKPAGSSASDWKGLDTPVGPELNVTLAQAMERNGDLAGAANQYERALKSDKNSLPALLGYARLKDRQGKYQEAIELYERASRAHPQDASVYNDLALCLSRQGRGAEAAAKMAQAVKLQPERKLYRNNMAKLLVDVGEPKQAFEQLSAAHPLAVAHYNLGYLLAEKGDQQLAVPHFKQALALDPSLTDARRWLEMLQWAPGAELPLTGQLPPTGQSSSAGQFSPGGQFPPTSQLPPARAPVIERLAPDPAAGPQWIEPQVSPVQGARSSSTPLPQVLRPQIGPGPRYGMAPTGYHPPSQY